MPVVLFLVSIPLLAIARAATRRPRGRRPLWVVAMAGSELAGWWGAACLALLAGFRAAGWAGGVIGGAAQVALAVATVGFAVALRRGFAAAGQVTGAASRVAGTPIDRPGLRSALAPISRLPAGVTAAAGLAYGPHPRHVLDRLGPDPSSSTPRPALIHLHGGGWWRGRRDTQARPLLHHLATGGWQVFTPSYRLSPEVAVPGHLIDVKRAIAWIREHAAELGVDPGFVAVAGGSAGGNLAALAALTAGDAGLQPGFEDADTSVQACLPLYGVHDLLDAAGRPLWPYLETQVVQVPPATDPGVWQSASPLHRVRPDRPPFLVVHGSGDTLVDPDLSRRLAAALAAAGGPPAVLLEVPGANHGFDFFAGPRGAALARSAGAVLDRFHADHRAAVEEAG